MRAVSTKLALLLALALIQAIAFAGTVSADGPASAAASSGLTPQGVIAGLAADSAPVPPSGSGPGAAPLIRSVGCAPLLANTSQTITCIAVVDGAVSGYHWDAPGGYPPSGSDDVFFTSFGSHGYWSIRLTVCGSTCVAAVDVVNVSDASGYLGRLTADRGPGSSYAAGDPIDLCHSLRPQRDYTLKLFKKTSYGYEYQIGEVFDDGTGDCFHFLVSPEIGARTYRAEFYVGDELAATASVSINVTGVSACLLLADIHPGDDTAILSPGCRVVIGGSIVIDQEAMIIVAGQGPGYLVMRSQNGATHLAGALVTIGPLRGYP